MLQNYTPLKFVDRSQQICFEHPSKLKSCQQTCLPESLLLRLTLSCHKLDSSLNKEIPKQETNNAPDTVLVLRVVNNLIPSQSQSLSRLKNLNSTSRGETTSCVAGMN